MKKLFLIGAFLLSIFAIHNVYSYAPNYSGSGCYNECAEYPTNDCWCRYVRYKPCYYTTKRCITEQVPCVRKCCRYVPQYYQVQCCRYVPQYYCVTRCRKVPEYFCVQESKCCTRTVCEPQCRYVPEYCWKRVCAPQVGCNTCAP